jgi:hypothetical protein
VSHDPKYLGWWVLISPAASRLDFAFSSATNWVSVKTIPSWAEGTFKTLRR